ncbi:MAG TPA: helix-turn-helix domain-containing protein [Candidatus Nanoarchaeia archaeon]|nr:helix-turn-helix domain-containing protein [Candidatus Nanoarchaeia archaeon]
MDISALREAGLTDGEARVYIALLELGPSTTGPIVDKSKVAKSIVYQLLEKLIEKGLASFIIKEKTKYYQAAQPQKILDYIDEREKEIIKNKETIQKLLPELMLKQTLAKHSEAQIYEGFRGIQTVHEKTYLRLKRGEEYFYLGGSPFQEKKYHLYWQRDHVRRAKAGINCKILFSKGTDNIILKNRNNYKGCDARMMTNDIVAPAWFLGYKDVTVIGLQSENGLAIEIINQQITDSFKAYFDAFWKQTKKFE